MVELFHDFWFLLFTMIVLVVAVTTLCRAWVVTHRTSAKLAFEAQLLMRDLPVEEIERLMVASGYSKVRHRSSGDLSVNGDALNEVVSVLGQVSASPAVIEEVLSAFRSLDAATQTAVSEAMQHLVGSDSNETTGEQLLAVVRPMCQPREANERLVAIHDERIRQGAR